MEGALFTECTFFGHRDCSEDLKPQLYRLIEDLIVNHETRFFYVGRRGRFDAMVRHVLRDLALVYPEITYGVAVPFQDIIRYSNEELGENVILPDGIEDVPPRYAIEYINRWMLRRSDYVIAYVTHSWGGAAKFVAQARRQGKTVFNLGEEKQEAK